MRSERTSSRIHMGIIIALLAVLIILLSLIITNALGLWGGGAEERGHALDNLSDSSMLSGQVPTDPADVTGLDSESEPAGSEASATGGDSYESIANYWENSGVELVAYDGIVEHMFFHPCVAYPELAFDGDYQANGIDDWMVTAGEYQKILESLYANDYIMVDINSVYSEVDNGSGGTVMKRNTLYIPEGKKPIIISYDDVNYYDYMRENGFV